MALNRVQYAGFDFDTFLDEVLDRTLAEYGAEFNDLTLSDLGIVLLDHVAFALDTLGFYLDRRSSSLFLVSARTRDAVARNARGLGYKIRSAVASSTDVLVSLTQSYGFAVTVPVGFQFQTDNATIFEVAEAVTFTAGQTGPKTVPVYQGQTITETFVSDGTANQEFELRRVPEDTFVVAGRSSVTVDGASWTEEEFLPYGDEDAYEIQANRNPPIVRFGDGIAGNIPAANAQIVVTYVASRGAAGRVAEDTITSVVNSLTANFETIPLTVTNPEGATGGADPEPLSKTKALAGKVFKTREKAVTREDYESLTNAFADPIGGRVAVGKAFVPRIGSADLTLQNEIIDIESAVGEPEATLTAVANDQETALDNIDTELATILSRLNDIGVETSNADTSLTSSITSARNVKNRALEVQVDGQDIQSEASDLEAVIDGIGGGAGTSQLTTADFDTIKAHIDKIEAEAGSVVSGTTSLRASSDSEIAAIGSVQDNVANVGLSTTDTGSLLEQLATARSQIVTEVGDSTPTGLREDIETIRTAVDDLDTKVQTALDNIETYFSRILANDCKTNVVNVPILAKDASGFYTAPSVKLRQELQTDLESRKAVEQTVAVSSGENFLVPVVVSARVRISTGVAESVMEAAVNAAIDGVLREREFGASLYESELYTAIESLDGVVTTNATIDAELDSNNNEITTRLDSDGNLIIEEGEVITKGTTNVTIEVVT